MWRPELRAGSASADCPDLLQDVQAMGSPLTPLYLSFFEEECRAIAARLHLGAAAEPLPGPEELSPLQPEPAGFVTSTPLPFLSHGRVPESSPGDCQAAAAPGPGPAPRELGCLPQPAAGGGPGASPARPSARSQRVRRCPGQPSRGGPGTPARSLGRGRARLAFPRTRASPGLQLPRTRASPGLQLPRTRASPGLQLPRTRASPGLQLSRTRASLGLQLPAAGTGRGAWETRLLRPPGTRLKLTPPARSRLQHTSGASQQAQPSKLPKPSTRDREMKTAVKVGSRKQPSSRLSTAITTVASRSSVRPPGKVVSSMRFCPNKGSATQELVCSRTQKLKENGESNQSLVAPRIALQAGKTDLTWVCVDSSLSSELAPGLTSGCEDPVPAEQSAGDQLSQELERVKKQLEQVKGELADKTAQCEAYQQTISSLQAQLRAAGIRLKDARVFNRGDLGRD